VPVFASRITKEMIALNMLGALAIATNRECATRVFAAAILGSPAMIAQSVIVPGDVVRAAVTMEYVCALLTSPARTAPWLCVWARALVTAHAMTANASAMKTTRAWIAQRRSAPTIAQAMESAPMASAHAPTTLMERIAHTHRAPTLAPIGEYASRASAIVTMAGEERIAMNTPVLETAQATECVSMASVSASSHSLERTALSVCAHMNASITVSAMMESVCAMLDSRDATAL